MRISHLSNSFILFIIWSIVTPAISLCAQPTPESHWQNNARRILQLSREIDERTASSAQYENADKTQLTKRLKNLQQHLTATEKDLTLARKNLSKISTNRAKLADKYQREMADMKTVEGIVKTALHKSIAQCNNSPVASLHPYRLNQLKELATGEFFLRIKDMQKYTDLLFADMRDTGLTEARKTEVIDVNGRSTEQLLYRAGGFFLGYQDGDKGIFALPQGKLPPTSLMGSNLSSKTLVSWISGESDILPMDITGGTAFNAIQQEQGINDWVEAGGLLLYPILLAGLIGTLVTLLKTIHLFSQKRISKQLKDEIFLHIQTETAEDTLLPTLHRCPAAKVMYACLTCKDKGLDAIDSIMEESIIREQSRLERFLSTVGVLASISPLLGLLGTVTGMIDTFQAITIYGTGDPRMMSTGISEALITTQAGLGVALPLLLAHHFLKRRVAALVADMDETGWGVSALLAGRSKCETE